VAQKTGMFGARYALARSTPRPKRMWFALLGATETLTGPRPATRSGRPETAVDLGRALLSHPRMLLNMDVHPLDQS